MDKLRKNCPICECDTYEKVFFRDFTPLKEISPFKSYDVVICEKCGLVYANNIISNMPIFEYYDMVSKYDSDYGVSSESQNRYKSICEFISKKIYTNQCILDIGCATGGLLYNLKKMGYKKIMGLEPSLKCAEYAKDNYDIDVYVGSIYSENNFCNEKFDLIILEQVLEHIIDLKIEIKECLKYLKEDGKIYIGVPNLARLFEYDNELFQAFSTEHINYFNLKTLEILMSKLGFSLLESQEGIAVSIQTIWRKENKVVQKVRDDESEKLIFKYINNSNKLVDKIKRRLNEVDFSKGCYIWGAGTHTAMIFQIFSANKFNIKGIIDFNKNYIGKKIIDINISFPCKKLEKKYPIIISSQYSQNEIEDYIKNKLKLENEIIKLY